MKLYSRWRTLHLMWLYGGTLCYYGPNRRVVVPLRTAAVSMWNPPTPTFISPSSVCLPFWTMSGILFRCRWPCRMLTFYTCIFFVGVSVHCWRKLANRLPLGQHFLCRSESVSALCIMSAFTRVSNVFMMIHPICNYKCVHSHIWELGRRFTRDTACIRLIAHSLLFLAQRPQWLKEESELLRWISCYKDDATSCDAS